MPFADQLRARETRLRETLRQTALELIAALSRPELVGRAFELADLISRWNLARRGRTQRVVVHGRSGAGKSRLSEELRTVVEHDRGKVVPAALADALADLITAVAYVTPLLIVLDDGLSRVIAESNF